MFFVLAISSLFFYALKITRADSPAVVINEVCWMGSADSSSDEWLELRNLTDAEIDLTGWKLSALDGSPLITLSGKISAGAYFLLERTDDNSAVGATADQFFSGALDNDGEKLELKNSAGEVVDILDSTGVWLAGDNTSKKTMERTASGNWQNSALSGGTPRVANSSGSAVVVVEDEVAPTSSSPSSSGADSSANSSSEDNATDSVIEKNTEVKIDNDKNILITEIYPNPTRGSEEFIELYNSGTIDTDLSDWVLQNKNQVKYIFPVGTSSIIKPGQFLALYRHSTRLVFDNQDDVIKLFQPFNQKEIKSVAYKNAPSGASYGFNKFNASTTPRDFLTSSWYWSTAPTPGKINRFALPNHLPVIDLEIPEGVSVGELAIFDASDSYDLDCDDLRFRWDFGDGISSFQEAPEHVYQKAGSYKVKLTLSDGKAEVKKEWTIKINAGTSSLTSPSSSSSEAKIVINEIYPKPGSGSDDEWIELVNVGDDSANLSGWSVDDGEGGSSPYKFKNDFWLAPGAYYLLKRGESKIALNDSNESVRLFNPAGKIVDKINYAKAIKGNAYARNSNNQWQWTSSPTPNQANGKNFSVVSQTITSNSKENISSGGDFSSSAKPSVNTTYRSGQSLSLEGVVSALPGTFGVQYFYISFNQGQSGLQIYNYKKDFPDLKIGDLILVRGTIGESGGEFRLKTKTKNDIKILTQNQPLDPFSLALSDLSDDHVGALVKISGTVSAKKGQTLFLDDGGKEATIYAKQGSGVSWSGVNTGEALEIIGVVNKTTAGLRILPRSNDDLIQASSSEQVLGEREVEDEWSLAGNDQKAELVKYLFIIFAGAIILGAGFVIRRILKK